MTAHVTPSPSTAWDIAAATPDPELPMVTIGDLGILRRVVVEGRTVVAVLTPTYSGCPAMYEIGGDVRRRLMEAGWDDVEVRTELDPPWTSDSITGAGRRKIAAAGIAPPQPTEFSGRPVPLRLTPTSRPVECPRCGSPVTTRTADFGATACKALYRCDACREPFEYLKTL